MRSNVMSSPLEATHLIATTLRGKPVRSVSPVHRGANNMLARIVFEDGETCALKGYLQQDSDRRDRIGTEFDALRFLEENDINLVPRALAQCRESGHALYSWLDGDSVTDVGEAEVDAAVDFIRRLHALRAAPGFHDLPEASEACLRPSQIGCQIATRIGRLQNRDTDAPELYQFLADELVPEWRATEDAARSAFAERGMSFDEPLPAHLMTPSPSDFGFHNSVRRRDGHLAFLDFEYFGRDDPAKLVADFVQHPGMGLPAHLSRRFAQGATEVYSVDDTDFAFRLRHLLALYGVRWCLIMLNEFLPERWQRRKHAQIGIDQHVAQTRQLEKSRRHLRLVKNINGG